MKRIAIALLASAAGLAATSARADTRVSVGINIGPSYRPAPAAVVVAAPPAVVYAAPPTVVYAPATAIAPRGYWQEVRVKTWVPERWIVSYDRRGRPERCLQPGYYTYTTDRVWVATPYAYGHPRHRHR